MDYRAYTYMVSYVWCICIYRGSFTSWQHVSSYQAQISGDEAVTVPTHGNSIVLPQWATRLPATWPDIPQSHYPNKKPTSPFPILIMLSAWLGSDKYKSLCPWFDLTRVQTHEFETHELLKGRWTLNSIEHSTPSDILFNIYIYNVYIMWRIKYSCKYHLCI